MPSRLFYSIPNLHQGITEDIIACPVRSVKTPIPYTVYLNIGDYCTVTVTAAIPGGNSVPVTDGMALPAMSVISVNAVCDDQYEFANEFETDIVLLGDRP